MIRHASPITRLRRRVNAMELAAADDIVAAYSLASGMPGGLGFEPRIGRAREGAADAAAARRADILRRHTRWRSDLRGTPALAAAVAVLVNESSLRETDRAHRWRNGTCMAHLVAALRHYAALSGNAPRGARWRYGAT